MNIPSSNQDTSHNLHQAHRHKGDSKPYCNGRLTHTQFKDMKLTYSEYHNGYRIMTEKGPVNVQHLESMIENIVTTYLHWDRVFSVRVDLYFPKGWTEEQRLSQDYFSCFIRSLNEQMAALNKRLAIKGNHRDLSPRYYRTVEVGKDRGIHIHTVLMFNGHQFRGLGDFGEPHVEVLDENGKPLPKEEQPLNDQILQEDWLARKVLGAWASALFGYDRKPFSGDDPDDWRCKTRNSRNIEQVFTMGLVRFSGQWVPSKTKDPVRRKKVRDKQIKSVIYRSSYLCKAVSKQKLNVSSKRYIKVAQGSSIKRNDRGIQKAKRFHRYQISWPLYQEGNNFDCLASIGLKQWQPDLEAGNYIQPHLEKVLKYMAGYQQEYSEFTLVDFKLNIKTSPYHGASNALVIQKFIKEMQYQLRAVFYDEWMIKAYPSNSARNEGVALRRHNPIFDMAGLQKEIVEDGQRKLHFCLLLDTRLWQKIQEHPQLKIEQLLLGSAAFTLEALMSSTQNLGNNLQALQYASRKPESGQQFEKVLDSFSRLALSENTTDEYVVVT